VALRGGAKIARRRGIPRACVLRRSIVLKPIYIDRLSPLLPPSLAEAPGVRRRPRAATSRAMIIHEIAGRPSFLLRAGTWSSVRSLGSISRSTIAPRSTHEPRHSPHGRTVHPARRVTSVISDSRATYILHSSPRVSRDTLGIIRSDYSIAYDATLSRLPGRTRRRPMQRDSPMRGAFSLSLSLPLSLFLFFSVDSNQNHAYLSCIPGYIACKLQATLDSLLLSVPLSAYILSSRINAELAHASRRSQARHP